MSGRGTLCVGPRRSLCRAPALSASGPGVFCVGRALFMSGPGAASCSTYKLVQHCRYVSWRLKFRIKTLHICTEMHFYCKAQRAVSKPRATHPAAGPHIGGVASIRPAGPSPETATHPAQSRVPACTPQLITACHPSPQSRVPPRRASGPGQGRPQLKTVPPLSLRPPSSEPRATHAVHETP